MNSSIVAMAADIKRATTYNELQALAALESEYPHVFVPSIRMLLCNRLMNWIGRKPYRRDHKPITGRPRKVTQC